MKKNILKTLITLLAIGGATLALAETDIQNSTSGNTETGGTVNTSNTNTKLKPLPPRPLQQLRDIKKDARAEIKDIRQDARMEVKDLKERMASSTAELKDRMKENIQNRIQHRFDKMLARFQATIEREEKIMAKIVSRIEKIKANGGDVGDSQKNIDEAKGHIAEAKTALESLKTTSNIEISQEIASSTREALKNSLDAMKKAGRDVEKHLRLAHKALQKTIGVLRGVSQLHNATSTKENE